MAEFHIEHFGCRAARADGEAMGGRLRTAGLAETDTATAEVVVVNTCSVTAEAERAARAFIRRTHRVNPQARIVVTGCYAQRAPGELAAMAGVSAVVGNSHKAFAPEIALGLAGEATQPEAGIPAGHPNLVSLQSLIAGSAPVWADDHFAHSFIEEAQLLPGAQTRPNLKVQEGCNNRCTFCVIPFTRGPSRSLAQAAILHQVKGFVEAGGNELVLSGINLGRWGRDLAPAANSTKPTIAALAREILEHTTLPRLRFSSIEPMDWDQDLISVMADFAGTRVGRHAHLPLQSGSDSVLRRMHRRYRPWHYSEKIEALLGAAGPELTIGADVMIGFPGETEAEFEETMAFVRELPFGYLHIFPFSPRPDTRGWELHAHRPVAPAAVQERIAALRALGAEKTRRHRARFIGHTLDVLTLHTPPQLSERGSTAALSENFLPVEIEGHLSANKMLRVRITEMNPERTLLGFESTKLPRALNPSIH